MLVFFVVDYNNTTNFSYNNKNHKHKTMKKYILNQRFKLFRSYHNNSKKEEKQLLDYYYETIAEQDFNRIFYLKYYNFFTRVYEDKIAVMLSWVHLLKYVSITMLTVPVLLLLFGYYVIPTNIVIGSISFVVFLYHNHLKTKTDTEFIGYMLEKHVVEQSLKENSIATLSSDVFSN